MIYPSGYIIPPPTWPLPILYLYTRVYKGFIGQRRRRRRIKEHSPINLTHYLCYMFFWAVLDSAGIRSLQGRLSSSLVRLGAWLLK
jgi:hypothetical protein